MKQIAFFSTLLMGLIIFSAQRYSQTVIPNPVPGEFLSNKYIEETDQFVSISNSLEKFRGIHPRLYLNNQKVGELREAIKTTHSKIWGIILSKADVAVKSGPPDYEKKKGSTLWQRNVGDMMPNLAMAWLITKQKKYLNSAQEWALTACSYPNWGTDNNLEFGHLMLGTSIVYDWCYNDLSEQARSIIRDKINEKANNFIRMVEENKVKEPDAYLQNHLWIKFFGLFVGTLAVFDHEKDYQKGLKISFEKFQKCMESLGNDGASIEGAGYWSYGVEFYLKYMHLSRELLGVNFYDTDWWRNTSAYCQYSLLPKNSWTQNNHVQDLADCRRVIWYGPDHFLHAMAKEFRDEQAQRLAEQLSTANIANPVSPWLDLLWYDPSVGQKPESILPTQHYFNDIEIVSSRSSWNGDESLLIFKCGPVFGHFGLNKYFGKGDPVAAHTQPDANHFILFGDGEWLIRASGYINRSTTTQNTLLINGKGQLQLYSSMFWDAPENKIMAEPRIIKVNSTPEFDNMSGDATQAYTKSLGLSRYIRHLIFVKPNVIIIVDDILANKESDLELRFHPEQREALQEGPNGLSIPGKNTVLYFENLTPENTTLSANILKERGDEQHDTSPGKIVSSNFSMFTIQLKKKAVEWQNAVVFSWSKKDSNIIKANQVTLQRNGDNWKFNLPNQTITLNLKTAEAVLSR